MHKKYILYIKKAKEMLKKVKDAFQNLFNENKTLYECRGVLENGKTINATINIFFLILNFFL